MAKLTTRTQKVYNSKDEVVGEVIVTYNPITMVTEKLEYIKVGK